MGIVGYYEQHYVYVKNDKTMDVLQMYKMYNG